VICPGVCNLNVVDSASSNQCADSELCRHPDGRWCRCQRGRYHCAPPLELIGCVATCVEAFTPVDAGPSSDAAEAGAAGDAPSPADGADARSSETGA
jgi:hypothetical protein